MDVEEVAGELYALTPEQFTPARNARAKEAKAAGDQETAAAITALRKPTAVAWLANALARQRPEEIGPLLDLGDALREATATLSGPELRELSAQRHRLVYAMVQQARAIAAESGRRVTDDVARKLEDTLTAALNNEEYGEQLRQARLTDALLPGGFPTGPVTPVRAAAPSRPAEPAAAKPAPERASGPTAEERRRTERKQRLQRDLIAAELQARKAEAKNDEAADAFDDAQRALTQAELVVADLRAELGTAEKSRDQAQRESQRAQALNEKAGREADASRQRVADLQARLDDL